MIEFRRIELVALRAIVTAWTSGYVTTLDRVHHRQATIEDKTASVLILQDILLKGLLVKLTAELPEEFFLWVDGLPVIDASKEPDAAFKPIRYLVDEAAAKGRLVGATGNIDPHSVLASCASWITQLCLTRGRASAN